MFELDLEMIAKLRERRGRKNLTKLEASKQIGISSKQLGLIENERLKAVQKTVYMKLVNWMLNEKGE